MKLDIVISAIGLLDEAAMQAARARQDVLTKPRGSLGRLEEISIQVAGMVGDPKPRLKDKVVIVMAGDHGVVEEGVSAYPSEVTAQMVQNFLHGGAAINVLARQAGARISVVDMGIASDVPPTPALIIRKVGHGTTNLTKGPAMSRVQAVESILAGVEIAEGEMARGLDILATGDMGIGNTTASTAIAAALGAGTVEELAGHGTGVDEAGLIRKVTAIQRGLEVNQPDSNDGLDVLSKVGGFEIGGLTGTILAAAARRKPVIVDGFISTAAAMLAVSLAPAVRNFLVSGHVSTERGHRRMLDWLGLKPLLDLGLRLGEGTGAVLALMLVEAACSILNDMATFDEAKVTKRPDVELFKQKSAPHSP